MIGQGRLLHVIQNADLRGRHDSLLAIAKAEGVNLTRFNPGDIVAFVNTRKDRLAVLVMLDEKESYGFLGLYKSPHGRVPPEAFEFIPKALGVDGFQMNKAIKAGLEKLLGRKNRVQ